MEVLVAVEPPSAGAGVSHLVADVLGSAALPVLRASHLVADALTVAVPPELRASHLVVDVLLGKAEQVFIDGTVSHPLTWITLTKRDGTKEPYAEVDLNDPEDYYDGYKRPRVERFLTDCAGAVGSGRASGAYDVWRGPL